VSFLLAVVDGEKTLAGGVTGGVDADLVSRAALPLTLTLSP